MYQYYGATKEKLASSADCEAEQVHVTLGNSLDSVIVSYSSNTFISQVYWSSNEDDLKTNDLSTTSGVQVSTGTYRAYSELYCE